MFLIFAPLVQRGDKGGIVTGLPKKICEAKIFWEEGAAGVKENSLSLLKLFQNAPCGDVVHPAGIEPTTFSVGG